jgi:hypothetical protein
MAHAICKVARQTPRATSEPTRIKVAWSWRHRVCARAPYKLCDSSTRAREFPCGRAHATCASQVDKRWNHAVSVAGVATRHTAATTTAIDATATSIVMQTTCNDRFPTPRCVRYCFHARTISRLAEDVALLEGACRQQRCARCRWEKEHMFSASNTRPSSKIHMLCHCTGQGTGTQNHRRQPVMTRFQCSYHRSGMALSCMADKEGPRQQEARTLSMFHSWYH